MKHDSRHTKTPRSADRDKSARERHGAPEPPPERERRIGAAQLAAPSTRTWRRAGRFSSAR